MTDMDTTAPEPSLPPEPSAENENEDDRRAAAAAENRKRAQEEWESNKKLWRGMGVPTGLPAKK